MPQVPVYEGPRVRSAPLQPALQDVGAMTTGARDQQRGGAALTQAGDILDKTLDREAQRAAFDAETRVTANFLEWEQQIRTQRQGAKAAGVVEDTDAFLREQSEAVGKDLSPYAKSIANKSLGRLVLRARASAMGFQNDQLEKAYDTSLVAAKQSAIQLAAANPVPENIEIAVADVTRKNAEWAARRGWTPEVLTAQNLKDTTELHSNVIKTMQQLDPKAAEVYFEKFKKQIDGTRYDEIAGPLRKLAAEQDGEQLAGAVWNELGPKSDAQPVELDKMLSVVNEKFKDDPTRRKAAAAAVKEQAAAFNASQRERAYGNTNTVMQALASGTSFSQVQRMPEFQALPGQQKMQIIEHQDARANAAESRAASRASRAASEEQRALTAEIRRDKFAERRAVENGNYYKYNDPEFLKNASPAQIQALAPEVGVEQARHLMDKKQQLMQSPKKEIEAKVDKQDFDAFVRRMGIDPLDKDTKKAGLVGEVQFRVEQLIAAEQATQKRELTRAEKNVIMNKEVARTATVDGGWFSSNTAKPIISMTAEDLSKVVIPAAERTDAVRALQELYKRNPNNAAYAPTEDNLKRLYLIGKSRSATLIPTAK